MDQKKQTKILQFNKQSYLDLIKKPQNMNQQKQVSYYSKRDIKQKSPLNNSKQQKQPISKNNSQLTKYNQYEELIKETTQRAANLESKSLRDLINQQKLNINNKFYCCNHQNRQAKYMLSQDNKKKYYCQNCVSLLNQKDLQLIKNYEDLNKTERQVQQKDLFQDESMEKQQVLNSFVQQINQMNNQGLSYIQEIDLSKNNIQNLYIQQQQQLTLIQNQIEKLIDENIQLMRNQLEFNKNQIIQSLDDYKHYIKQINFQFIAIKDDITQNQESIVQNMQMDAFQRIINMYSEKVDESQEFFKKLINEKIQIKTIKFNNNENLEQIIVNFLDLIIEQVDQNVQLFKNITNNENQILNQIKNMDISQSNSQRNIVNNSSRALFQEQQKVNDSNYLILTGKDIYDSSDEIQVNSKNKKPNFNQNKLFDMLKKAQTPTEKLQFKFK